MDDRTKGRVGWGLLGLAVVVLAVYGVGLLLTSNAASVVGIDYHAGKLDARNNTSSSHSSSTSANSLFQARRLAIMRQDEHPVLDAVAEQLRDDLLALAFVDSVDVYGPGQAPGHTPEPGTRLHDGYLTLGIDVTRDDKPFLEREFEATVRFAVGEMPYKSHSSYIDHLSVPSINYWLKGQLEHSSVGTQAGTPYKMIAENIGEELSKKLTEQFVAWQGEYGGRVDWPDDLIGEYPYELGLPWPGEMQLVPVVDGYGLMRHRHLMAYVQTDDPESVVQAFHEAYTDAGWRMEPGAIIESDEYHQRYHFRAWDGSPREVEVFEMRDGYGERETGEVSRVVFRYQHRFDRPETRAVIDRLLEHDGDLTVLRYLTRQMDRAQSDAYYAQLAESRPTDPHDLIALSKNAHRQGHGAEAEGYLRRAWLFSYRVPDKSDFQKKLNKTAKEIGLNEAVLDAPLTVELLAGVGYEPLNEVLGDRPAVGLGEAVQLYYESRGELHTLDLWMDEDPNLAGGIRLNHYERQGQGSSSWGTQGANTTGDLAHGSWHVRSGTDGYRVHLRQSGDDPAVFEVQIVAEEDAVSDPT